MTQVAYTFDDASAYERYMGRWSRAAGPVFLNWLAAPGGASWLDVGCGTGIFTELILESTSPKSVAAVDPAAAQIEQARRGPAAQRAEFQAADAQALPFADNTFDVVASSLVLNFIPDRLQALAEMRRVARPGAIIAGYVWDYIAGLNPNWPVRRGLEQLGLCVPPLPGTEDSSLDALSSLFDRTGLKDVSARPIEVSESYTDFDDFWQAQTPGYSPPTKIITALTDADRARLIETVRAVLPARQDGRIHYASRANAVKARVPT